MAMKQIQSGSNNPNYRHGGYGANRAEYNSWRSMIARCTSPKYWAYHRYGGRGVKVCERWSGKNGFINFLEDMGKKPEPKFSLDRVDGDGNYTPENCRWANDRVQKNNTSRNVFETVNGVTKTRTEWSRDYGIPVQRVYNRLREGWDFEKALTTPLNKPGVNFTNAGLKRVKPRKDCANCGKQCELPRSKYCGRACYLAKRWGKRTEVV